MLQPNLPQSSDFTDPFTQEAPRLANDDLQVKGVQVPPEPVATTPDPPAENDAVPVPVELPPRRKKSKAWLLLPLLALGAGAYFKSQAPTTAQKSVSTSKPVTNNRTKKKLKALWEKGAAAKKRGDLAAARAAWQEGLKIEPANVGFRESIAKLNEKADLSAPSGNSTSGY